MTRAMLIDGNLPDFFWPLAAQAAMHIKNRLPHAALHDPTTTPFELWFKRKANLSHLRPFGATVTSRKTNSDDLPKLEPRGETGRFVGYARDAKGYLVWFPDSRAIRVRRDLVFHDIPILSTPRETSTLWDDVVADVEQRFRDSDSHAMEGVEPTISPPSKANEPTAANEPIIPDEPYVADEPTTVYEPMAIEPAEAIEPVLGEQTASHVFIM